MRVHSRTTRDQLEPVAGTPRWTHDARIRAAVVAAPAASVVFDGGGLHAVTVPVQLWRAERHHQAPDAWNSAIVRHGLRVALEERVVHNAGHFVFVAPCSDAPANAAPQLGRDAAGFDRVAFHREFNRAVVAFFRSTLGVTAPS